MGFPIAQILARRKTLLDRMVGGAWNDRDMGMRQRFLTAHPRPSAPRTRTTSLLSGVFSRRENARPTSRSRALVDPPARRRALHVPWAPRSLPDAVERDIGQGE